jgi:hypothetical protein
MKIEVTVKSIHERPSEHRLSPAFAGDGFDHKETFICPHAKEHALLFCKVLDLSAMKCGIDQHEFASDPHFTANMNQLIKMVDKLHEKLPKNPKKTKKRSGLEGWTK